MGKLHQTTAEGKENREKSWDLGLVLDKEQECDLCHVCVIFNYTTNYAKEIFTCSSALI